MLIRSVGWIMVMSLLAPALVHAQARFEVLTPQQRKERALAAELDVDAVELVALEKEMAHAKLLNNPSFFQRVLNDDYRGVGPSGEVLSKTDTVTRIQSSSIKYYSFIPTDLNVRVYDASAVVSCLWTARGEQNGHAFSRQYRVIHVYVNNKAGGWKIVASQETQLPG